MTTKFIEYLFYSWEFRAEIFTGNSHLNGKQKKLIKKIKPLIKSNGPHRDSE
jgi:hypothetical protein